MQYSRGEARAHPTFSVVQALVETCKTLVILEASAVNEKVFAKTRLELVAQARAVGGQADLVRDIDEVLLALGLERSLVDDWRHDCGLLFLLLLLLMVMVSGQTDVDICVDGGGEQSSWSTRRRAQLCPFNGGGPAWLVTITITISTFSSQDTMASPVARAILTLGISE